MSADDRRPRAVAQVVHAIAEDEPIDESLWRDDDPTLSQLRILYEIGRIHRAALAEGLDPAATGGVPPPVSVGPSVSRWAHFYLLDEIGRGTSGVVYRAWDSRLAREVAVKLLRADQRDPAVTLEEARRLARVRHPHFVTVYGVERVDGQVGIWMELLKGATLHEIVRTRGPLSALEAALVGADVCSSLAAVHSAGLLHRDVKAHNVAREHGGRIVLMDLGAGREIDQVRDDLAGTPLYLAPELLAGQPATTASDLYSVGVLLFFLTTDSVPVPASTVAELRTAHRQGGRRALRDVRPDLPRAFVDVVDRALSPAAKDRFASAGEMERALAAVVAHRSRDDTVSTSRSRLAASIPTWVAGLLVAVTAVASIIVGSMVFRNPGPPAAEAVTGTVSQPVRVLMSDQLKVARGFEELASSLGGQGRWRDAVSAYRDAERIYRLSASAEAPLVAKAVMNVAWAQYKAGEIDQAIASYEVALAKFKDSDVQPFIMATLMGLARAQQQAGRYDAAATAIDAALEARALTLGLPASPAGAGLGRLGCGPRDLAPLMRSSLVGEDQDGDWLPDVIELAVGLDPRAVDTDNDGVRDTYDDHDHDGVSNHLEFGLPLDPTGVIVHHGSMDPEWLGFEQPANYRVKGQPVATDGVPAWRVEALGYVQYFTTLTHAQRAAALSRGWRMTTRGLHHQGRVLANVDLVPEGPRFDLEFIVATGADGLIAQRNVNAVPRVELNAPVSTTGEWPIVELEFDPSSRSAQLLVNGAPRPSAPYFGHRQFQEGLGVYFGLHQPLQAERPGSADFRLVMFTIR